MDSGYEYVQTVVRGYTKLRSKTLGLKRRTAFVKGETSRERRGKNKLLRHILSSSLRDTWLHNRHLTKVN